MHTLGDCDKNDSTMFSITSNECIWTDVEALNWTCQESNTGAAAFISEDAISKDVILILSHSKSLTQNKHVHFRCPKTSEVVCVFQVSPGACFSKIKSTKAFPKKPNYIGMREASDSLKVSKFCISCSKDDMVEEYFNQLWTQLLYHWPKKVKAPLPTYGWLNIKYYYNLNLHKKTLYSS